LASPTGTLRWSCSTRRGSGSSTASGAGPTAGPRELGDVAICPEHCSDLLEAAVHGTLHLCGMDHEGDNGEMLDLQERLMAALR
jgi:probable rRNA maturation factor